MGYAIRLEGWIDAEQADLTDYPTDQLSQNNPTSTSQTFSIGIGKAAYAKHQFKVNDTISGGCLPVPDLDMEPTEYYKVSKLKLINQGEQGSTSSPWEIVPPELEVYRERGHRRLSVRTYDTKCSSCIWGARMSVEIIVDNWNPRGWKKYRFETFCYGPLSCIKLARIGRLKVETGWCGPKKTG